ncbi:MAG TPA: MBL fold metallo-hydrolase [Xanthobacteraceae bacterium]|nr:MBL fold metallo-hydrolase [Xanthobacteraceae bacterium]
MKVTIVGSGDAFGSGGRFNTCFMIETGGRSMLLDFGASSLVALRAHGIDPNRIEGIIISHLHGDHFGGLPFLLLDGQFLSRRTHPLVIAGPPGSRDRINALLEVFFPRSTGTKWRFPWEVIEIVPGVPGEVLGLKIMTAEVIHPSGAPSTAMRLADGRSVLAYSGDTEWTDVLIPIADGADLFIIECYEHARAVAGHNSWSILKERLADLKARRIMITHMNPSMLARTEEATSLGLLVAEDGLVLEI